MSETIQCPECGWKGPPMAKCPNPRCGHALYVLGEEPAEPLVGGKREVPAASLGETLLALIGKFLESPQDDKGDPEVEMWWRAKDVARTAKRLAEQGDVEAAMVAVEEALRLVAEIRYQNRRDSVLCRIVSALVAAEKRGDAIRVAGRIEEPVLRMFALREIERR